MTLAHSSGERDAEIIPFPLERVRRVESAQEPAGEESLSQEPASSPRQAARARRVSLHALGTRGLSRQELQDRLVSRGIPEEHVEQEINHLSSRGFVDDQALARELVDKYALRGGLGRRAVAEKLRARDLSHDAILEALSLVDDEREEDNLRQAAKKRAATWSSAPSAADIRRLGDFLMRRGFDPADVRRVISDITN